MIEEDYVLADKCLVDEDVTRGVRTIPDAGRSCLAEPTPSRDDNSCG